MLNTLLLNKYLELSNATHPAILNNILDEINTSIKRIIRNKKSTLRKKLNHLVNLQKSKEMAILFDFEFYPRVINQTSIVFSNDEMSLLNKGLKYNLSCSKNKNLFNVFINAEMAIKSIPNEDDRNSARYVISRKLSCKNDRSTKTNNIANIHRQEQLSIKSIKEKLESNQAILCKADKGTTTVIMYKTDYITKVNNFIQNNGIIELMKDPTSNYQRKIRKLINSSKTLFTDDDIRHLNVMNPVAPILRGLPKVHKEGIPVRPLVNYTTAPTFKLAKKLEQILKQNINLDKNYSIKNSLEFIDKTQNISLKDQYILVSFDIVNLYTNVPIDETIDIIRNKLNRSNLLPEAVEELINLLKETLAQNYFNFNEKFYKQTDGLAMGSPLSGLLADIYLNNIENEKIFSANNKQANKIKMYFRYVDDTVMLFNGNARQLDLLHKYLNSLSPKLKFTMEPEQTNKLNFLDLTLTKTNSKFDYSIYRKPTTTDQTIHSSSYHPQSHKLAAYNSMVHRLLSTPLSESNYIKEVNIIKHIAAANGYASNMVDNIISKHKNKNKGPVRNVDTTKYVCVEYNPTIEHCLKKELKRHDIELTFRTSNKLMTHLNKTEPKPKFNLSGVYKIKCDDCPSVYIGQTGRSFHTRYKEHHPDPRTVKQKSNVAQHLIDSNHSISEIENNLEVLHVSRKGRMLNTLEEFEIYKAFKNNKNILNDKLNFKSNILFNNIMYSCSTRPGESADNENEVEGIGSIT